MNELRVDIGGSNRGFEAATSETKKIARDLQRDLDRTGGAHIPSNFTSFNNLSKKSLDLIKGVAGESGGMLHKLTGLFGEGGGAALEMAAKFVRAAAPISILTAAIGGAYSSMKRAFELQREAGNLGLSATFLKGFGRASEELGIDPEEARGRLYRVTNKISESAEGDPGAMKLFRGMGVTIGGNTMQGVLLQIAEAFNKITDPAERAHKAVELFGERGQAMLPILNALSEKSKGAPRDAYRNLFTIDDEQISGMAKQYATVKNAAHFVLSSFKGAFQNIVSSASDKYLGWFLGHGDAPTPTRITQQESPEETKAKQAEADRAAKDAESQSAQKAKERIQLQRELREEIERTAPLQTRIKMLSEDMNHADNERFNAQMKGDDNGRMAAQIEFLKKKKELEAVNQQLTKANAPEVVAKVKSHIDSISGMGLISSVGAMTNPMVDIGRKQTSLLQQIATNTRPVADIYSP